MGMHMSITTQIGGTNKNGWFIVEHQIKRDDVWWYPRQDSPRSVVALVSSPIKSKGMTHIRIGWDYPLNHRPQKPPGL